LQKTIAIEAAASHIIKPSAENAGDQLEFFGACEITESGWNESLRQADLLESYTHSLADAVSLRKRMRLKVADSKDMLLFPLVSAGNVHGVVSILCRYE